MVLIDFKSMLITVGGTVMTVLACFSPAKVISLLKIFMSRMLGGKVMKYDGTINEIVELAKASRKGKAAFDANVKNLQNPFLKEAAEILYWAESDISDVELRELLELRASNIYKVYMEDANMFKTIAKFPPAFGLMGTTIGMIALLQNIGGDSSSLGANMAIALITTLYGLVLSNIFVVPVAENLQKSAKEDKLMRDIVVEGIMLIHAGKPTQYVEEKVVSYLLPSERPKKDNAGKAA